MIVHTDHMNLAYKHFNTECVMRWRLILREFGPKLKYIKGERNVVADALSRLELNNKELNTFNYPKLYGMDDKELTSAAYPLRFKHIARAQNNNNKLINKVQKLDSYTIKSCLLYTSPSPRDS